MYQVACFRELGCSVLQNTRHLVSTCNSTRPHIVQRLPVISRVTTRLLQTIQPRIRRRPARWNLSFNPTDLFSCFATLRGVMQKASVVPDLRPVKQRKSRWMESQPKSDSQDDMREQMTSLEVCHRSVLNNVSTHCVSDFAARSEPGPINLELPCSPSTGGKPDTI
jgi:hypothetical protein